MEFPGWCPAIQTLPLNISRNEDLITFRHFFDDMFLFMREGDAHGGRDSQAEAKSLEFHLGLAWGSSA